jgi:hypothetical protein
MNCDKELNLIHSKSKAQWWRIGLIWGLIITIGISNIGCSKESKEDKDEYYIKYEVNSSTIYYGGKLNVTINTENNINTTIAINTRSPWETVIGPVKKGFVATLHVSEVETNYGHLKLYTQISVSKNGSPFALKKIDGSETPRTSVQLNYAIDY